MSTKKNESYINSSSYQKALKKLAAQIARNIQVDVTYRNIPFGPAQLDIYSDGENIILAVKVLTGRETAFNVREFHFPASKLRKFLVSDKMTEMFDKGNPVIFLDGTFLIKQISQGISQLLHNSNKKFGETWVFPFYNHFITFTVIEVTLVWAEKKDTVSGRISAKRVDGSQNYDLRSYSAEGFENSSYRHNQLDYNIYRTLKKIAADRVTTTWDYASVDDKIKIIAA